MVSLHFFRRKALLVLAFGVALGGCVTVRPQDKEFLADPAMSYGSAGEEAAQEAHVLANRESALPGAATTAGGCGCN